MQQTNFLPNFDLVPSPPNIAPDFLESCKNTEKRLEANNRNSFNDLTAYLEFLNDLNECEKTYSEALRLSSFFPSENNEFYVIHLEEEEEEKILGRIKTLNLDPTASSADWFLLIRYHYLRGTIDELAYSEKPKPEKRLEKALIYYYAEDYQYVHSILASSNDLNCFEVWLLFIACQKLDLKRDMETAFSRIENSFPIPWRIILDDAFAALESFITPANRNRVLIYLHKQLESHPFCIKFLRLLSRISDAPLSHQYQRKALKLQLAYPNVTNQIYNIIETGSSFIEKYHSLLQLLKINPLRSIFSELLKITENNPEKRAEALSIARSLKTSFFYETQFAQELNPIDEKGRKEALEKVATLLVVSPNHKKLRLKKISLLIKLNRTPESIFEIKEYLKRFGSTLDLLTLLDRHVDNPCIREFHLEAHLEKFKLKPTPSNFNELIGLYRKYKSPIECIALSIEAAIISEIDIVSEDFYDALKELKNEKSALQILEKVPLEPCFSTIIANRALFYSNLLEIDNALRDIENVIKLKNDDKSKEYKLYILLTHRRLDEAVSFYFSVSVDFPSDIVVKLSHDLLNQKKYDLVEKVLKKSKRKLSSKEKKCLASSFIHLGKHQEAIAIFKELIKDDPQDENNYFGRALCYDALGQIGNAIDSLSNAIDLSPDREDWIKWRAELQEKLSRPAEPALKPQAVTTQPKMRPSAPDPKKVPYLIEEAPVKAGKKPAEIDGPKPEKVKKVLQPASSQAVDPLKDPLADIKAIAKKGEKETGPKEKPAPTLAPIATPPKTELPKPIVKLTLRPKEKVFLKKAHTALCEYNAMKTPLLSQEIVFRNQIYTILRVFTPLRLNAKHPQLIGDLKRIRDNARHDTDQISQERLDTLFNYLKSINLEHQVQDWLREKSLITKLMLQNQVLTVRRPKKSPQERVIQELEFILKNRGEKATFSDRLYHRNAIKASLSIIGEASNFLKDEQKNLLREYREAGNDFAHEFFVDGETLENVERLKEEEISPDALWNLIQNAETLLNHLKNP